MFLKEVTYHLLKFLLIVSNHFIHFGHGDLRFCLNGPHVMRDSDCPGGFFFEEGTKLACKYYAKTEDHTGIVLSTPTDICDENTLRMIENGGDDFADIDTFNYFMWEEMENTNDSLGEFNPKDICQTECLDDWMDTSIVPDEEPIPEDWDPAKVTEDEKKFCDRMNRKMFLRLLLDDEDVPERRTTPKKKVLLSSMYAPPMELETTPNEPETAEDGENVTNSMAGRSMDQLNELDSIFKPPGGPPEQGIVQSSLLSTIPYDSTQMNIIKMLARSMRIMASACAPFIREDFFEQVLKGMIHIAKMNEYNILDVGEDVYTGTIKLLDTCGMKRFQEFTLNGSKCDGAERVDGIYNIYSQDYWPYRLTGRSFRWGYYHPILDASWSIVDFIHGYCFENFAKNMIYGHIYALSMEELFPKKIQVCWRLDPGVKNDKFWNNVLQTDDLNTTMRNLDACAIAARMQSPYVNALPRPFLTIEESMRPPPPPSAINLVPKGWNKTIDQYWSYYERNGGFKKISSEFGKCFQDHNVEEQDELLDTLKKGCPGT